MANKTYQGRIVQKHDSSANWAKATNFIPLKGEIVVYDDLNKIKIGDGTTKVNDLDFINDNDALAIIAKTGNYNDLKDKPTIPTKISDLNDDVVSGKYLPLTGGTMTGNLEVGSTLLGTNGYVIGTWLKTTANTALGSTPSKIAVIDDGWIYSRTTKQIKSDIGLDKMQENLDKALTKVFSIGTTAPSDTRLLWIDTTSNSGLKYYNGSTWVTMPVCWSE